MEADHRNVTLAPPRCTPPPDALPHTHPPPRFSGLAGYATAVVDLEQVTLWTLGFYSQYFLMIIVSVDALSYVIIQVRRSCAAQGGECCAGLDALHGGVPLPLSFIIRASAVV